MHTKNYKSKKIRTTCATAVMFHKNKILLLYDHNWKHLVLPQGHVKKNENLKEAALREAMEETGYQNLKIIKKIKKYQYNYYEKNRKIYKTVNVYLIKITNLFKAKRRIEPHEKYSNKFFDIKKAIKVSKKYVK